MDEAQVLRSASITGRLLVGGGAVIAPVAVARVFGVPADETSPSVYLARLFGIRAVMMAALLARSSDAVRRQQLPLAITVDLVDAWSAATAGRAGQLSPAASRHAVAAALFEAGLGAAMLRRLSGGTTRPRS